MTYANWRSGTDSPGQLIAREPKEVEYLCAAVAEAKRTCDYAVVYMHWGIELDRTPSQRQTSSARALVDAGADVVIGAHPHVVQTFELYDGKPILYSVGNFLFNSLNNIYALITFDQSRAQLAMHNLSDMLRYQLYESNKSEIPLRKELEFVRDYCDLMKLRMPANVRVELDFPRSDAESDVAIAPLLFITLVENAFKHGVSPTAPSHICITIEATFGRVRCAVRNSCFPRTGAPCSESGIGLVNLRKRLDLLYPTRYTWSTTQAEGEYFSELVIAI
jgi:hypothetical protein